MALFTSSGFILLLTVTVCADGQLRTNFYKSSCPDVLELVKPVVTYAVLKDPRMAASLLRLHFHDCFVNGCDGSILLDDTSSFSGEKNAGPNMNSVRGFDVIDSIKAAVEKSCPGVVSCADILSIAARDAVALSNGPCWDVQLGRRDSTTASLNGANTNIPPPTSNIDQLSLSFRAQGLSIRDLVALSGAHTIGRARCVTFRDRIYNETAINKHYATIAQGRCPPSGGDNELLPLDISSATTFDNGYFRNLKDQMGLLHSDQILFSNGASTASIVESYIVDPATFYDDFKQAMIRMGSIMPLTGNNGQIRKNCRKVNEE